MNCPACANAERNPRTDEFRAGCSSCDARALAVTGAHLESFASQALTPQYREALRSMFGDEWKAGHDEVKRWAAKLPKPQGRTK